MPKAQPHVNGDKAVPRKEGFSQVVVWPGTTVGKDQIADFEAFMLSELGVRAQYLEQISTAPDMKNGMPVRGTGGRIDTIFAVHNDDVTGKFCAERLAYGMRWVEDVLSPHNHSAHLYPAHVKEYITWDAAEPVNVIAALRAGTQDHTLH
jgi:hypothetical protein